MGAKKKKLYIIIVLMMLCLLAGAWLLLYESHSDRIGAGTENIEAGMLEALTSDIGPSLNELAEAPKAAAADWIMADHVYSHRGSAGPGEHSFEAYDAAIEAGSHNIEQDIVISKDGTLYVSHDLTAAAMTGDGRAYADMSDAEIDSLTRPSGGNILKLSEVFERYGDSVRYVVELRSGDDATINAFKSLVDEYDKSDRIIVQSFDISVLEKLVSIYPDMPKLMVVKTEAALQQALDSENVDMVGARVQFVNSANCSEAHDRGKKFVGWTLDSEADIRNAIDVGADAYFTNDTPLALELEHKYRPFKISDHSTILFASDYQEESGFDYPGDTLLKLLKSVKSDGREPDMAVFCGDYTNVGSLHDYQLSPEDSIAEIREAIRSEAPQVTGDKMIFVQGNHDAKSESIAESGLHEYKSYLVYVLNTESDFPWRQGTAAGSYDKVSAAASEMKKSFDGLIEKGETRPVFIAGHVPLHYTARTSSRHSTGDNLYSSLVFDVVNEAAESLDIIYMFGHNHSKGWDCYMGGASVYKPAGESLLLPVFSEGASNTDEFEERKLNFTYMNAGYTGYYLNCAPGQDRAAHSAADETLTCTVCEIYKDRIEIRRYDENGLHQLGAAGEGNPYKGGIDADLIGPEYYSKETDGPVVIKRKVALRSDDNNDNVKEKEAA